MTLWASEAANNEAPLCGVPLLAEQLLYCLCCAQRFAAVFLLIALLCFGALGKRWLVLQRSNMAYDTWHSSTCCPLLWTQMHVHYMWQIYCLNCNVTCTTFTFQVDIFVVIWCCKLYVINIHRVQCSSFTCIIISIQAWHLLSSGTQVIQQHHYMSSANSNTIAIPDCWC